MPDNKSNNLTINHLNGSHLRKIIVCSLLNVRLKYIHVYTVHHAYGVHVSVSE